ncbi:MAG TPA: diaminopimelate epimerase [Pseudonocardiaceae bacterium]|jgi:diaminopimelate epimerase|nr:diaminopimelate epimerase [Pseudonocardiaceae bacterium]
MNDFAKYHALGNDYLVVDPNEVDFPAEPDAVRLLCDRHFAIGADGLLLGPIGPVEPGRPVGLRLFNPDGSPCERSGNGLRIFALYLMERYQVGPDLVLRTIAGDSRVVVCDAATGVVRVELGRPSFAPAQVQVLDMADPTIGRPLTVDGRELTVTALHNGNPHVVVPLPDAEVTEELARRLGPPIAGHDRFPHRTNVQFLAVLDRATIRIEIWERGAGYTLASGSSACAAACAAHALGLVDAAVEVRMPGGEVAVTIDPDGGVALTGVVEQVATGHLAPALRDRLGIGGNHRVNGERGDRG